MPPWERESAVRSANRTPFPCSSMTTGLGGRSVQGIVIGSRPGSDVDAIGPRHTVEGA
jgi:hypothetical protein